MGDVIPLVKCSSIEDCKPFLIPVTHIRAVEVRGPAPLGRYVVEIAGRPGPHWTWDLDLDDIPPGTLVKDERQPR